MYMKYTNHLIEFINSHPENWKELLAKPPYSLRITQVKPQDSQSKELSNLYCFKYNQVFSDFDLPECIESRGPILEIINGQVTDNPCLPWDKFFNVGETRCAPIDWNTHFINEKMDGSLIKLYFYKGKWRAATSGTVSAETVEIFESGITYGTEFWDCWKQQGGDLNKLNPENTYLLELCSKHDSHPIPTKESIIWFLGCRNKNTGKITFPDIGIQKPKTFDYSNMDEMMKEVKKFPKESEGVVIQDANGNFAKIKADAYLQLHYLNAGGKFSKDKIYDIIKQDGQDDIKAALPHYVKKIEEIENQLKSYQSYFIKLDEWIDKNKSKIDTPEYAQLINSNFKTRTVRNYLFTKPQNKHTNTFLPRKYEYLETYLADIKSEPFFNPQEQER